ncbi:hypothetical protein [Streptomyces sp. CA-106131]|uniref:hypothetical protein n=1 Tax=Streptomyces sp. CA-106131 TaxID=3240045 RepID=UPI003D8D9209
MASGAYEEISLTGQLGPQTFEVLRRLVHQVHRSSGFPPPEGYSEWSDDAAYDVITGMLTREGAGQRFVTSCFVSAVDDSSLERLFLASIKNFLIDEAKKTPRGKLRRRIASRMAESTDFRRAPGSPPQWALSEYPENAVWQGDLDDLIAVAWRVRGVGITRWNHSGPTPARTVEALMTILTQVLRHAGGVVREEDLAKVLEARFELLAPARFTTLYADDGALVDPTAEASAQTDADPAGASGVVEDIWRQLTGNERLLLPYLDEGVHHAAQLLEVGQAQAAAVLASLKAKLRLALADDSEPESVMRTLLQRCSDPPVDPPSDVVRT